MSDNGTNDIPADIRSYLDEISERLWSGHAAVMVGAGFSRNAHKTVDTAPNFPSWHDLANQFYKKLHNSLPDAETHYLDPLKLADEVQSAFGRPALDQLLRTHIPDREHEPSELHVRLLELPWVDVFTVNYDTLLERACVKVSSRRFDVVINKEDIVYSSRPRIVKLHGSLPSTRPFIISEEDYRRYPREQAPFVNTVQQALIENTLCLIGFSGEDPNFLHWMGWVRDNLGKENQPKVFLVGILSLTSAQKALLEKRNVVVLDLAQFPNIGNDHAKALSKFLSYLFGNKPSTFLDWPRDAQHLNISISKSKTYEELIVLWREQRNSYPNWIVAPKGSRESLWLSMHIHNYGRQILNAPGPISPPSDITFLYELNWCFERMLCPILNDVVSHYERVIARYNPYPNVLLDWKTEVTPDHHEYSRLDWNILGPQWLDLNLSILRFYREEDVTDKWAEIDSRIERLIKQLSPDQLARWHYERCLKALFAFNIAGMKLQIASWPVNTALPFWEAKRAGILAELGDVSEADRILEESLAAIRSKQQLVPVINDFTWVSQECHVMNLLHAVKEAKSIAEKGKLLNNELRQKFNERWNELKAFKCDQWNDLQLFDAELKAPSVAYASATRKKEFDIGRESLTHQMGSDEDGPLLGYNFLRYCEDIGLPFALSLLNIAETQAQHAAERIAAFSAAWALVTLLRIGKSNLADSFFNRESLARASVAQIDARIDYYINVLRDVQPTISEVDPRRGGNFGMRIARVVPEILSRLCVKCSPDRRDKIFSLLRELYENPEPFKYDRINHLVERLLGSWSAYEKCQRLRELLEMPIIGTATPIIKIHYPEPFIFLRMSKNQIQKSGSHAFNNSVIKSLLTKVASSSTEKRSRACIRLELLHRWGLLDDEQANLLGKVLWEQTVPNGFPTNTSLYRWAFLTLPAPDGINVPSLFKEYINNWSYAEIDAKKTHGKNATPEGKKPVKMTCGEIAWCLDLIEATKRRNGGGIIDWSAEEAVVLLDKLIGWWNSGKDRIRESDEPGLFGSIPGEFRARYHNIVLILAEVIAPRLTAQTERVKERLRGLIDELDKSGIQVTRARAACIPVFPEEREHVFKIIARNLTTSNKDCIRDASQAVLTLLHIPNESTTVEVQNLLSTIGQQIKWRRKESLVISLQIMRFVVKMMPDRLPNDLAEDVLIGLDALRNESAALSKAPIADIEDRLEYRKNAAAMAYALHKHFTGCGLSIPSVIFEWQKICLDTEEFAEIRNQWQT